MSSTSQLELDKCDQHLDCVRPSDSDVLTRVEILERKLRNTKAVLVGIVLCAIVIHSLGQAPVSNPPTQDEVRARTFTLLDESGNWCGRLSGGRDGAELVLLASPRKRGEKAESLDKFSVRFDNGLPRVALTDDKGEQRIELALERGGVTEDDAWSGALVQIRDAAGYDRIQLSQTETRNPLRVPVFNGPLLTIGLEGLGKHWPQVTLSGRENGGLISVYSGEGNLIKSVP